MKLKRPKLSGPTKYLGRFQKAKHLNRGHNTYDEKDYDRIDTPGKRLNDTEGMRYIDKLPRGNINPERPAREMTNQSGGDAEDSGLVVKSIKRPYMGVKFHKM